MVIGGRIDIPPGDPHYVVKGQLVLPRDVEVTSISPHAHYLGRDLKLTAYLPNGTTLPLIWIKDWDFNWQGSYQYEKPIALPKDTKIELEYIFDNSEKNPRNPSRPPVRVRWGEQTTDEMALAFLGVALPTAQEAQEFTRQIAIQYLEAFLYEGLRIDNLPPEIASQQRLVQGLRFFDRNGNGILDADEREAFLGFIRGFPEPARREELASVLYASAETLRILAILIQPIMPTAAERLWEQLGFSHTILEAGLGSASWGGIEPGTKIRRGESLFPRLDA